MDLVDIQTLRGDGWYSHLEEVETRIGEIDAEADGRPLDPERQAEWDSLTERRHVVKSAITQIEKRKEYVGTLAKDEKRQEAPRDFSVPNVVRSRLPENIYDLTEYRGRTSSESAQVALTRDGAKKAAEQGQYFFERTTRERCIDNVHKLLDRDNTGIVARRILSTGSDTYARAFGKLVAGVPITSLSSEEQRAIATVGATQLGDGGYAVPYTLDSTVVLTNDGAVSPLRQISRVEQLVQGNEWRGVTSAGITVVRGPAEEGAITADVAPTFAQPAVTVQPVKALAKVSIEATEDWPRVFEELAVEFQDAKMREEAAAFATGVGTTVYPGGVVSTLDATSHVATADVSSPIALALTDIFKLKSELPIRFREGAAFLANDSIYDLIRQFSVGTVGDGSVWTYGIQDSRPDRLLGKPAYEASAMDDDMTEGNEVLLYGNFRYFLIVDKVGMNVEIVPHLVNGDGNLTGQRGVFMHYRNSSAILADNAFRLLVSGALAS